MSLRGSKEVRPLISEEMHDKLLIIAAGETRDVAVHAAHLLEMAIAGEWLRYDRLLKRIAPKALVSESARAAFVAERSAGFVYVIRIGRRYKIGKAEDWRRRIAGAMFPRPPQVICVIATDNRHALERSLHVKYKDMRLHGEWFGLGDAHISELLQLPNSTVPA